MGSEEPSDDEDRDPSTPARSSSRQLMKGFFSGFYGGFYFYDYYSGDGASLDACFGSSGTVHSPSGEAWQLDRFKLELASRQPSRTTRSGMLLTALRPTTSS